MRNSDLTAKARIAKAKINDYIKLKRFHTVKKINNAMKSN